MHCLRTARKAVSADMRKVANMLCIPTFQSGSTFATARNTQQPRRRGHATAEEERSERGGRTGERDAQAFVGDSLTFSLRPCRVSSNSELARARLPSCKPSPKASGLTLLMALGRLLLVEPVRLGLGVERVVRVPFPAPGGARRVLHAPPRPRAPGG